MTIAIGQPFPQPLVDGATYWSPEDNLIVICDEGLGNESHEALTIERIWVNFDGPLIVLTLTTTGGLTAEVVGAWIKGRRRPAWLDDDPAARLLLSAVWVENANKQVVRIHAFTLSPHATQTIRRRAGQEWAEPLDEADMLQAVASWRTRFSDQRNVKAAAIATSRPGA
jgi:hypothetical protein